MVVLNIMLSLLWWGVIIFVLVKIFSGRRRKYYSWLQRELPVWEEKHLISKEQGDVLLGYYKLKRVALKKKMDMLKVLTLIGAIFVGLGVIFFVGSNWQRIPEHIRTTMLLGVTIATLYAGYIFSFEKRGFDNVGKSLLLLATLFWGGTIALIGQIYQIPADDNWFIMLLWVFPIIPVALFFKNDYVHILASVLLIIWNFLYSQSMSCANYFYPIFVLFIMLPTAHERMLSRRINIGGLVMASVYCSFNKYEWLSLLISAGLLASYLLRKEERAYLYAATVSCMSWDIVFFEARMQHPNFYFLVPIGFLFYLTYKDKVEKNLPLCLVGLMLGLHLALCSISERFHVQISPLQGIIFQAVLGMAAYTAGVVSRRKGYQFSLVYTVFGYSVAFICFYILAFRAVLDDQGAVTGNIYLFASLILTGIIALFITDEIKSEGFNVKANRIELSALIAALAGIMVISLTPKTALLNTVVMNAVLLVFALSSIFLGVELKKPRLFTLGIVIFVLFIVTRYVDVTWQLKEKSLFFIFGGLLILCLGTFLEKQRKKIIERMKSE